MRAFARFLAVALVTLTMLAASTPSQAAFRCKDCPFPMKIGDDKWLMPDSTVIVQIHEQQLMDSSFEMSVSLLDSVTGELLAAGTARRTKTQRSVEITLIDPAGREIDGEIKWVNYAKGMIQARFSCMDGTCSIQRRL